MSEQSIFGIDLGTTYSCIAYVDDSGKPTVVPNMEGQNTTPSVVLFDGQTRVVGKEAKSSAVLYPNQVVEMVKRFMGSSSWRYEYEGNVYTPDEISSYILRKVVGDAEQQLGHAIKDVIITCPAYFSINQREATANAGRIAGLNVREVINEPTAAAIAYGLQDDRDQVVLVYDLGGGTFDVTMIKIEGGSITVVATDGDHELGGRDWDLKIVSYLAEQWKSETGSYGEDPMSDPETLQDLWQKAEDAKMSLTAKPKVQVAVQHAGQRKSIALTREQFDEMTADLLGRTIEFTRNLLVAAQERGCSSFDQLLLVGGSTKMPQVKERLMQEFGKEPRVFDPDQAVAKGAAAYGQLTSIGKELLGKVAEKMGIPPEQVDLNDATTQMIQQQAQKEVAAKSGYTLGFVGKAATTKVTNVSSHSYGLVSQDDQDQEGISNLIVVNDPLPCDVKRGFGTQVANQTIVTVRIMENNSSDSFYLELGNAKEIATADWDLPSNLPKRAPLDFTFTLDNQGLLHIFGKEPTSGRTVELKVQTTEGATQEEVQVALERSTKLVIS